MCPSLWIAVFGLHIYGCVCEPRRIFRVLVCASIQCSFSFREYSTVCCEYSLGYSFQSFSTNSTSSTHALHLQILHEILHKNSTCGKVDCTKANKKPKFFNQFRICSFILISFFSVWILLAGLSRSQTHYHLVSPSFSLLIPLFKFVFHVGKLWGFHGIDGQTTRWQKMKQQNSKIEKKKLITDMNSRKSHHVWVQNVCNCSANFFFFFCVELVTRYVCLWTMNALRIQSLNRRSLMTLPMQTSVQW